MSVSALSSSSSSYWEKMLAQMKGSSESQSQDSLAGKLFGDLDSDGDGSLSLSETGLSKDLYSKIDADGDGSVTQSELQKAIETQRNAMFTTMQLGQSQNETSSSTDTSTTGQPTAKDLLSSIMNGEVPGGMHGAGKGNQAQGSGDDLASKLFSALDSDGSDGLSVDETGLSQSVFDSMDLNQDGSVSAEELTSALEKQRQAMMGNQQTQAQAGVQNQSSSQSSSGEPDAKTLLSSIMNGQMPPPPPMQGQGTSSSRNGSDNLSSKLFSSLDSDSSNGLSVDETGLSQSVFDSMDVNQDGSVSADELATALEKQRASMGSGQGSTTRTQIAQSFLSAIANSAYQTLSKTTSTSTQGVEAVA